MKPSFLNIVIFLFVKYLVFYLFLAVKNSNYAILEISNIQNGEDLFYYLWIFLFLPVVFVLIMGLPLYYSFKMAKGNYFVLMIAIILLVEYLVYTYFASPSNLTYGIFNALVSVLVLLLLFFKSIKRVMGLAK